MENFYEKLNIPDSCKVDRVVFKKLFYENEHINNKDKERIKNEVEKVIWKYALKEDTIHIRPFKDGELEYQEVAIIEVEVVQEAKVHKIAEILQRVIPYPLILIFSSQGEVLINLAEKRSHHADQSKVTIEELFFTDWIDLQNPREKELSFLEKLDIETKSFTDFRKLYFDYLKEIHQYNLGKYKEVKDETAKDTERLKEITKIIEELEKEIQKLKKKIKKEKHLNKKVQLNVALKKLEQEKQKQIDLL